MVKLEFELIPDGCWKYNLRTILSKAQWDFLKAEAKKKANGKCAICGKETARLEAHERWSYNTNTSTQKLEDIVAVCKDCHAVIHINRTWIKGNIERAENHYMKINNCSYAEYRKNLGIANEKHKKLNEVSSWKLDLTCLKKYVETEK